MVGADGRGPAEQARVDSLYELAKDIQKEGIFGKAAVRAPKSDLLVMYMKAAEEHAPSCSDGFWVGTSVTLADVAMFQVLLHLIEIQSAYFDAYPKLKAFTNAFMKRPAIDAY